MPNLFKRFDNYLHNLNIPNWLCILLAVVLILRIPTFLEPYSYGDEMIYLSLGEGVRQGKVLYRDIHDNKPPLLYLTAALAGNLFWFKAILAFWSLITIVLFYKLAEYFFPKKEKLKKTATIIFAILTTLPLFEGNIANAENFMIGTTIAGFLILLSRKLTTKNILFAGLLFSISTLFKVPAAFDVPAVVLYWAITSKKSKKEYIKIAKNSFVLFVGFIVPILITIIWYWSRGAFKEYVIAAFLQNVGYLSSFRPEDKVDPFFVRNLPLLMRAAIVGIGIGILAIFRKKISKQFLFISIWLLLTLFAVALSERPYPHYLLQSVPALSFLFAILLTIKSKEQTLVVFPIILTLIVPIYFRFWYYPTTPYYTKFAKFAVGSVDKDTHISSFGGHILPSYRLAEIINKTAKKGEEVLIWGPNSSLVYALSRRFPPIRYVAQYHISDFSSNEEVLEAVITKKPKLIVILPDSPKFLEIIPILRDNYFPLDTLDGYEVWSYRKWQ